jgi:glutamyl-tRNA synthetase
MSLVVGRLAPSPTGGQHLGNARTYLIAWLSARSQGGRVLLRIEDIDAPRVKPGYVDLILEDLRWLGLDWDGEPMIQSHWLARHEAALHRLQEQELVYPCMCSRADIRATSAPHVEDEGPVYPGTCAGRRVADAVELRGQYVWRLRTAGREVEFADGFRGPTRLTLRQIGGDFVVWRSIGVPAYQLAVVVDDAEQGVTEVIRGDDLVFSTPRQLLLYEALGWTAPRFTHVPLVLGRTADVWRSGQRPDLASLRASWGAARSALGLLAWTCGWLSVRADVGTRTDPAVPSRRGPAHARHRDARVAVRHRVGQRSTPAGAAPEVRPRTRRHTRTASSCALQVSAAS